MSSQSSSPSSATLSVLVAQIGVRRHYAVPRAFQEAGLLEKLVTDACAQVAPWSWIQRLVPGRCRPKPLRMILGRDASPIPSEKIQGNAGFYLGGKFGPDKQRKNESRTDYWTRRNHEFGRRVISGDWAGANTVYAYNGAALEIFERGSVQGLRCVLDQTAAPWSYNTELLQREQSRWPDWEPDPADIDGSGLMIKREEAEWELADRIVCGSQFVVDAMEESGGPVDKCRVVPYPSPRVPPSSNDADDRRNGRDEKRVRVLFAGSLQLRKGIQYFYEAAKSCDRKLFEFRALGPVHLSKMAQAELQASIEVIGSVPRHEVWNHYRWADVFVLPTLSEGSANVCHEALACGLPVITTKAAGIPPGDVRLDGVTILENNSSLVEALQNFVRPETGNTSGSQRPLQTWDSYVNDLKNALDFRNT